MRYPLLFAFLALSAGLAAQPVTQLPYSPSLDITSMDASVQPCEDFYRYSCGNWSKKNPIPADQASWDVYGKLAYDNERLLWGILDQAAKGGTGRGDSERKIGDYFQACMDEPAVEKTGLQPIAPALKRIAAIQSLADLAKAVTAGHADGTGSGTLFNISSDQDLENSQSVIAFANRGALGLPDRDYYTKTDAKSVEIRKKYVAHMASVFELLGDSAYNAASKARLVMAIETELASSMLTRVELRDPHKLLHKMDRKAFQALTPSFAWDGYFSALGLESAQTMNVTEPAFYQALEKALNAHKIADWRAFLRWNLIRDASPYLSSAFVSANFEFYSKYLRGVPEQQPRWRRCVRWTDRDLGEVLGQVFVARTFTPETKARAVAMTKEIELAMENDLKQLPWMGDETRKRALEKLHSIVNKVGYPDKWRDYSALTISVTDFGGNVLRSSQFEDRRQLAKIGKPLDRTEWGMTPPTVNAYYNPQMNDINFPAGVLQPPLFDSKLDESPNYGNTGSTIGHELTHGFDDEGRQFDAQGNLKDWWTAKDGAEFDRRAKCISDQYSGYIAVDDIHINGKLTLGEDVADLGGTMLAYYAWKHATEGTPQPTLDGLAPDQRYFVGMAQWACGEVRPEMKRERALTDPHSPLEYRVNGVVSNMPEFAHAYGCKAGQPMVRKNACRVW
jgi:endothelin-converting enzyme/putative endopeptidase